MDGKLELENKSTQRAFYFLCFGVFFTMISLATHLPAYPHMLDNFKLDAGYAVWMQLGLALGLTVFQPLLGWLGDTYSQKNILIAGALFMIIGSLLVVLAPAFWVLVLGLFFKGLAGAATAPTGVAYAGRLFIGERRGRALGLFAFFSTAGALFGPLISGVFVDTLGWASTFWLTAIFGVISLVLFSMGVPAIKMEKRRSFDFLGVILVLVVLLGLLTIPTFISTHGFSSGMWIPSLVIFTIGIILLIVIEKRTKEPLLDIEYATHRNFWVPSAIAILLGVGFSGCMYLLTFFVQNVQGKSGTLVGLMQTTIFLGSAVAAYLSGRWMKKYTARKMAATGMLIFIAGITMLTFVNIMTTSLYLFISMALIGIGAGFKTPVIKAIIVSKAATSRINVVTFTANVIESVAQRVGASFSLVAFALFAASGNGVSAISKTSLIFVALAVISLLLVAYLPKKIPGIHDVNESQTNDAKVKSSEPDPTNV